MEFAFSTEQLAFRDATRELFEKESPPSRLRELWSGAERDPRVWRAMAEIGIVGVTTAEVRGGMGGDEVDLVLLLEEAGRAALPEPLVETVAVGVPTLAEAGTEEQKDHWLPRIARGEAIVSVQIAGAPYAVDADDADLLLLERGGELHALSRDAFGARPVRSIDGARRIFEIDARPSDDTRLSGGAGGAARAVERGAAAVAAFLNGLAQRMLEMTIEYVRARHQFGRPVGSFQAVKHKLADAHVLLESSRAAAWYAAYAIANDLPDRAVATSVAKATAAEAESFVNLVALQCHGGIGFTWEHDLHLWLKRGKALEGAFGTAAEHRKRLASHVFGGGTRA
jgi:alkylation response protein AidB-like acyl-CoA dehydrogenase